ncbi:MAG: glutathione S-transferase N-terminal domain-containing protein [Alphaproteobacteria bacterium]|nr:glutathione S-transferase N-terminal domain-containing protein [Alphaproteobacteria bacterium]
MIDLYYWPTPNGWKITIMLEECGLDYNLHPVDIRKGDQFTPEFLAISPNNRMPAIVDRRDPDQTVTLFESGAILAYLAETTGRFMPSDRQGRYDVLQWVFWQVGGLGPMAGQLSHFVNYAEEENPYALDRYAREYDRLLGVLNRQLSERDFIVGDYSIADMAAWPWLVPYKRFEQSLEHLPHVQRWHNAMKTRPAVRKGVDVGKDWRDYGRPHTEESRRILFGQTAQVTESDSSS